MKKMMLPLVLLILVLVPLFSGCLTYDYGLLSVENNPPETPLDPFNEGPGNYGTSYKVIDPYNLNNNNYGNDNNNNYDNDNDNSDNNTPGFELLTLLVALFTMILLLRLPGLKKVRR